ncbi:MAG: uroporphyrinogen-III synthase [Nitrosopumilaceae archaeon]|jgi:uroporphyrinogen-III synthase|uniref:Uroporphyrinogen-III synthase n=3 Tax=Candidatus Nitrosomaritimum aestuariumsis TaxID=3342354 RepID=A0AC60W971_9ARCH|nr:uroporphyrinogen-III synthase [Nitrosopumilaceae archaeon]MBA4454589.1 uroporphyrinogen-III synthase [Nitrosopumilaceae archaeon]MBA4461599.1 uroporphyrinogen-III synthase [Nitrosopumilaceae archaeon]MBA4463854.1 uroporphyrinogen-III synthase [Nitrosopumilaceae archaeon]NCF21742.1 uroporphyrinogen-III synthase [Nitrosopumilaceae archaeon]
MINGKKIAITRSKDDAAEFIELTEKNNAQAIPLPTIELVSKGERIVDEFLESIKTYNPDYSVFMSSKAVKLLFNTAKQTQKLEKLQLAVANTMVMSVGPKTTLALENEGIKVNYQPTTYSSVGVGEEFTKIHAVGKKVIVPRSGASTPFLKELLNKIGIDVLEIHLYDVCAFRDTTQWNEFRELFSKGEVDGIIFTSASSVRGFFEIMSKDYEEKTLLDNLENLSVVSIGPFTSDELKKFKIKNIVAEVHTVAGAFDSMKSTLTVA